MTDLPRGWHRSPAGPSWLLVGDGAQVQALIQRDPGADPSACGWVGRTAYGNLRRASLLELIMAWLGVEAREESLETGPARQALFTMWSQPHALAAEISPRRNPL